jgi:hypothetical protein
MTSQTQSKLLQLITSRTTPRENKALPTHLWLQTFCNKCIEDVYYFTEDNVTVKTWCIGDDVWMIEEIKNA